MPGFFGRRKEKKKSKRRRKRATVDEPPLTGKPQQKFMIKLTLLVVATAQRN